MHDFIVKKLLKQDKDFYVSLVDIGINKQGIPIATIPPQLAWCRERATNKIKGLFTLKWIPHNDLLYQIATELFFEEIFGSTEDMGKPLFDLMRWHFDRDWKLDHLSKADIKKSEALEAMTVLTRRRYWEATSPNLNMRLAINAPDVCALLYPIVAKVPIRSIQYFIDVHSSYAFNSIRKSGHQNADDIIAYLYEVLFLQQKIAICLHTYICSTDLTYTNKKNAVLIKNETDAIISAEAIFTYLKASIEKTIALLGCIYGMSNLDSKKTHKAKISALNGGVPEKVKEQAYFKFVSEYISSQNIDELNKYRTGLLHKKGISDLQPHNYYNKSDTHKYLTDLFDVLFQQHIINSAIIICTNALLTDELIKLDPADFKLSDLPYCSH
jgi:hypothetical protein